MNITAEESRALLERLTGYTPEPWREETDRDEILAGDDIIATPAWPATWSDRDGELHTEGDFTKAHANARLIAASPDLVTHLRAALAREAAFRAVLEGACYGDLDGISKMGVEHGRCLGERVAAMTVELRARAEKAEAERDTALAERDAALAVTGQLKKFLRDYAKHEERAALDRRNPTPEPVRVTGIWRDK